MLIGLHYCKSLFFFEASYVEYEGQSESTTTLLYKWVHSNYGYANLLMGFCITIFVAVLFKSYRYAFPELLILICYVMGINMLLYAFFGIIDSQVPFEVLKFGGFISIIYTAWAIGHFFKPVKWYNYLKAIAAYLLGMIGFFGALILLGNLIDWIKG